MGNSRFVNKLIDAIEHKADRVVGKYPTIGEVEIVQENLEDEIVDKIMSLIEDYK